MNIVCFGDSITHAAGYAAVPEVELVAFADLDRRNAPWRERKS